MQGEGTSFAKPHGDSHFSKIFFPLLLARRVVAVQSPRAEIGKKMLSISGAGWRCEAAFILVKAFVRHFFASDFLPFNLSCVPIDADNCELINLRRFFHSAAAATGA